MTGIRNSLQTDRLGGIVPVGLVCYLACALVGASAYAAIGRGATIVGARASLPDLVVGALSNPPGSVGAGQRLTLSDAVKNAGRGTAKASTEVFLLSLDTKRSVNDITLPGGARVKALKPHRSGRERVALTVPVSTPSGEYYVLACANGSGKVKEKNRKNDCRASTRRVRVTGGAVTVPGIGPGSSGGGGGSSGGGGGAGSGGGGSGAGSGGGGGGTQAGLPPDPASVAPQLTASGDTTFADGTAFLYSGSNPIQKDVQPGAIELRRAAVLRGKVETSSGAALGGVKITIADHPELGDTLSRGDGAFDMAVNGGGQLTVHYGASGYLPVERQVTVAWNDYAMVPDVAMIGVDSHVTAITNGAGGSDAQAARASTESDGAGTRQNTLLFPPGTIGTSAGQTPGQLDVRATEFTVGANGPARMPAELPPTSQYTYAVDLSADGQNDVTFNHPVYDYVENYLKIPAGTIVPNGFYDTTKHEWVADRNGRVIKIVSETGGKAQIDANGDGNADSQSDLDALGFTDAELTKLATLYQAGQELWRVPITHFSYHDFNYSPPPPPKHPPNPPPPRPPRPPKSKPCDPPAILCEMQAAEQTVSIAGTPFHLRYESDRAAGNLDSNTLHIPVTGSGASGDYTGVQVTVEVAGQQIVRNLPYQSDQATDVTWDGKDAYGRPVQGSVPARITIDYKAPLTWCEEQEQAGNDNTSYFAQECDQNGHGGSVNTYYVPETDWTDTYELTVGHQDTRGLGLGGWGLDVLQSYDPAGRILSGGDGSTQGGATDVNRVVARFAGAPNGDDNANGFSGDGGPAGKALLANDSPDIAAAPDGSLYISDTRNNRIRKVASDGTISTYAGSGDTEAQYQNSNKDCADSGDGGAATSAVVCDPGAIALGPDGSLYVVATRRIRRVDPSGKITTFAGGTNNPAADPQGAPATHVELSPTALAAAADGSVYIGEDCDVRRVDTSEKITTVVNRQNVADGGTDCGYAGDGGPAASARVSTVAGLTVAADGTLYLSDADNHRVRRVKPGGTIDTFAGNGATSQDCGSDSGGDGGPATSATIDDPTHLLAAPDGSVLVVDSCRERVRRVGADGIITTFAGHDNGCPNPCNIADNVPTTDSDFSGIGAVAVGPDDSLYVSELNAVRRIASVLPGISHDGSAIPSQDGSQLYELDDHGREQRAVDTLTGATLYSFAYDAAGRLTSITDRDGNVTQVERDANGQAAAIVAPGGQRTQLTLDGNGYLASIGDPDHHSFQATYDGGGLMTAYTERNGGSGQLQYDAVGRVKSSKLPSGATTTLSRAATPAGYDVTVTSPGSHKTVYSSVFGDDGTYELQVTDPNHAVTDDVIAPDGVAKTTYPDGSFDRAFLDADPRFGYAAPFISFFTHTEPDGSARSFVTKRTATLATPGDPLSVKTITDAVTASDPGGHDIGANSLSVSYAASSRTLTTTTPEGRTETDTIDDKARLVKRDFGAGVDPLGYVYDSNGRLTDLKHGSTTIATLQYDSANDLTAITDGASHTLTLGHDAAGLVNAVTTPEQHSYQIGHVGDGQPNSLTMPSGKVHQLAYTADGLSSGYAPPDSQPYTQDYTADLLPQATTLPSAAKITNSWDPGGRLTGIAFPDASYGLTYADASDRATKLTRAPAGGGTTNELDRTYNGDLTATTDAKGASSAHWDYTYDPLTLNLTDIKLTAGQASADEALAYDGDGLVTTDGPYAIDRSGPAGSEASISDSALTLALGVDSQARQATRDLSVNGNGVYSLSLQRDGAGRIVHKDETINGASHSYDYTYDKDGHLTDASGGQGEHYAYDPNGNRSSSQVGAGAPQTASYDSQDRLTGIGLTQYTFDADGFLASRGSDQFHYSAVGELLSATVGGKSVNYSYDGYGRRVARSDSSGTTQYLYGDPRDPLRLTATKDPSGSTTSYYYDDRGLLYALNRDGTEYAVATDEVGTPKLVLDSSGNVVEQRDYDSFGNLISDSAPSFGLPVGFAGGLADPVTGLVRFGFRDYDPATGRFTARDPLLYLGGDPNLYAYAGSDPVGNVDPTGLDDEGDGSFGSAFGNSAKDVASDVTQDTAKNIANQVLDNPDEAINVREAYHDAAREKIANTLIKNPADEYRDQVKKSYDNKPALDNLYNRISDMWRRANRALHGDSPCP